MSRTVRLGMFIVATLAILATGILLIGSKQFLFASTYRLRASFKNVAGLANGAPVRVGGIGKGTVRQIQLPTQSNGEMTVVMDMASSTRDVIKKDSVAVIQSEGLVGNKFVEISFGSENAATVQDGDTIGGVPPLDISDLLKKGDELLDASKQAADHLQAISASIDHGKGTLGALVNDKKVYDELKATTEQARLGATAFQENMQALKSNWFLRGFFNRRGYQNSAELTRHEIRALPKHEYQQKFEYGANQLFERPDSAKLKNRKLLDEAGKFMEASPFGLAVVVAYTGKERDAEDNRMLTQARAMVVRDCLAENFRLDDTRIKTMGLGEEDKVAGGSRVEIIVYARR